MHESAYSPYSQSRLNSIQCVINEDMAFATMTKCIMYLVPLLIAMGIQGAFPGGPEKVDQSLGK